MAPRILIVVNVEWYFLSHRLGLAKALQAAGCDVTVAAGIERGQQAAVEVAGLRFIPLNLRRRSVNPLREAVTGWELFHLYRQTRPDLVHHITIKPVLYGSLAARLARVPAVINTIPGLGYTFQNVGLKGRVIRRMISLAYRAALAGLPTRVIFQNQDDQQTFIAGGLVKPEQTVVIRSSGVDTHRFVPTPLPSGTPVILLAARLLWDKGVGELAEAARLLKAQGTACRVVIVGLPDNENPNAVQAERLRQWQGEGILEWWGLRDDMPEILKQASIVTLPSYYPEGMPKILLEAAASARPIVTVDAPGCREITRQGENGLLVPPRDAPALAQALETLLSDRPLREKMGRRGREIVEAEFGEERVIGETLAVYRELLGQKWTQP